MSDEATLVMWNKAYLERQLAAARNEALEEAAQVVDQLRIEVDATARRLSLMTLMHGWHLIFVDQLDKTVAAIRAMKEKDDG